MNNYSEVTHNKEHGIFEQGYADALLDVYDYLTGNPSLFESINFDKIDNLIGQITQKTLSKV